MADIETRHPSSWMILQEFFGKDKEEVGRHSIPMHAPYTSHSCVNDFSQNIELQNIPNLDSKALSKSLFNGEFLFVLLWVPPAFNDPIV